MKQYLLFDLDGTLTDPKVGICTCVQYALASFGIEEPDLDKLEPFIGPPLKNSFMNYYHLTEEQAEEAVEKYRERFKDTGIFENKLYDGIEQMLIALNSKGIHLAVASSKPQVFVERILEHFHIARYFRVVVGSELDGTRVNKEEVIEEALRQLFGDKPVDKSQVYMIGDRRYDAEGAKKVGVESVCVTYGYGSMEGSKGGLYCAFRGRTEKFPAAGDWRKAEADAHPENFTVIYSFPSVYRCQGTGGKCTGNDDEYRGKYHSCGQLFLCA